MAIRSLLDEGISEPKPTGQKPAVAKTTISDKIQDMVMDTAQATMALKLLGFNPGESVSKQAAAPEYAAMFNGQNQLLQTLLTQITTLSAKAQDSQTKAEIAELKGTVQDLVKALSQQPADPLKTFAENYAVLEGITERFAKKSAVSGTPLPPGLDQAGLAALPVVLKLKELDIEIERNRQQHEVTLAEMRRNWVKEDRLAAQQIRLEEKRLEIEQSTANKKADQLGQILGAIAQSLDLSKITGGGTTAAQPKTVAPLTPPAPAPAGVIPKEFQCGDCGQIVTVASPDIDSVECPTCGSIYNLEQFESPPATEQTTPSNPQEAPAP